MTFDTSWLGTVWSHRSGRTLIGRVTSVSGDFVTMVVAGIEKGLPAGLELMRPGNDGVPRVRVERERLLDTWKRMGPSGA